jgi:hypothetical protein
VAFSQVSTHPEGLVDSDDTWPGAGKLTQGEREALAGRSSFFGCPREPSGGPRLTPWPYSHERPRLLRVCIWT